MLADHDLPDRHAPDPELAPRVEPTPRSRRAILAAALGGVVGSVAAALGRPAETRAAAGSPLILGQTNYAGTSATRLNATSSGGAFWMTQNGSGSGVRSDSTSGHGGVFTTAHADRTALLAQQNGSAGTGAAVRAEAGNNWAVHATASDDAMYVNCDTGNAITAHSNFGYSIYAGGGEEYAGFFDGQVYATEGFVMPLAPILIDHPLEPEARVLEHRGIVSNEDLTVYAGRVTTDSRGEATVDLPAWFGALNTDVRYQLTPLGDSRVWVEAELADNQFKIGSSAPRTAVWWQLTGVRQDAYAVAHPVQVEAIKPAKDRGRYLNPAEHGQPESKGIGWELRQRAKAEVQRT